MGYPTQQQWRRVFKGIPVWAVILLVVLLYGRLALIALYHLIAG